MNTDELWAAIDAQRRRTVALLEDLAPAEWAHASLCDGWTVRDVAAHLTLQQLTLGDALQAMLRHPGSLNHVIHASAVSSAARPTDELVAGLRDSVGSRRINVGVTPHETLIDILVHGQDIAIPLGRRLKVPPEAAATAATRIWSGQATAKGRRMARVFRPVPYGCYRFIATDTEWAAGEGPEIRGPILAILLLFTGRTARYADLSGPGAVALGGRLGLART